MTKLLVEAKSAEVKSWFDNDVFNLVDIRNSRSARLDGPCAGFKIV